MTQMPSFDEQLQHLNVFFTRITERGMDGYAGAVWPVIVRKWGSVHGENQHVVHLYPETFFRNMRSQNDLYIYADTKNDRLKMLKLLVDKLMKQEIDIYLYHFGLYLLYPYLDRLRREEDAEAAGKKRSDYMATLPWLELKNNDDFISSVWSDLIERRYPEVGNEIVRVPSFTEIRMLFAPERFGNYTGTYYSDADWLEPKPGPRLDVTKWVGEKDPMKPQPKKEGMIEGPIVFGHEGSANGYRHFVEGEPVRAGSYIEVKFGDGWIAGRYEWSFEKGAPIQIHSSRDERFLITEGHLVRIRG